MRLPPPRSGGLLMATLALICLVVAACSQNAPPPSPPTTPSAGAAPTPSATPDAPPRNAEPRSQRNPPMPPPTVPPTPPAEPSAADSEPAPASPLLVPLEPLSLAATPHGAMVPHFMLYGWFFQHIVYLDRTADQMETSPFSDSLRRLDQSALGLTDPQAAILKEAAHDCTRIVDELSAKLFTAKGTGPGESPFRNENVGRIASAIVAAIERHVADLRPRLGAAVCDRMDSYVGREYGLIGRAGVGGTPSGGQPGVPRTAPPAPATPMPPAPSGVVPARPSFQRPDGAPFIPIWVLYGWFFQNVAFLDRIAERQGIPPIGGHSVGMPDPQAAFVGEAAHDCISILEDLSAKFTAASRADSSARPPRSEQLGQIAAAMIKAVESHEADLRSRLEPDLDDRMDSYARGLFSLVGFTGLSTAVGGPPQLGALPSPGHPGGVPGAPVARPAPVPAPIRPASPSIPAPAPSPPKPDEDAATVSVVAADPSLAGLLYVGTARGIYVNPTGFENWSFCGGPLANASISALAVGTGETASVFAGTNEDGVFKSADRGKTWTAIVEGLSSRSVSSLLFEDDGNGRSRLYAGTTSGVFRSTDLGARWEPVSTGMSESRITVLGSGAGAVYAGSSDGRLYKTTDTGAIWSEESVIVPWSGAVHAIVFAGSTLFVATDTGIFKRLDGDRSWLPADTGLPSVNMTVLVASRDNPPALYGVIREGIWKSVDAGASWVMVSEDSPSAFAITPGSGSGPALYAGVRGTIRKSTDAGRTWKTTVLRRPAAP